MEFSLMCGEAALQTIATSLEEYAPKLLQYVGYEEPETIGEKEMISVLEALDKSVRPSGLGAKLRPFSLSMKEVINWLMECMFTVIVYDVRQHAINVVGMVLGSSSCKGRSLATFMFHGINKHGLACIT